MYILCIIQGSAGVIASGVWYLFNIGFGCGTCLRCETKSLMNGTSHVQGYINLWLYVLVNIPFPSLHLVDVLVLQYKSNHGFRGIHVYGVDQQDHRDKGLSISYSGLFTGSC